MLGAFNATFGRQYYPLGLLKLGADMCAFAGPLCLNVLVVFVDDQSASLWTGVRCGARAMCQVLSDCMGICECMLLVDVYVYVYACAMDMDMEMDMCICTYSYCLRICI